MGVSCRGYGMCASMSELIQTIVSIVSVYA